MQTQFITSDVCHSGELERLREENLRLTMQLEATQRELERTNALQSATEQVLSRATEQLQEVDSRSLVIQEELDRTARLAAVGEMAARVVHEVLNPMTSVLGRIHSMIRRLDDPMRTSPLQILHGIVEDWGTIVASGELAAYVTQCSTEGTNLFQEDLEDSRLLVTAIEELLNTTIEDVRFLQRTCQHMVKIVSNMRALSRSRAEPVRLQINEVIHDTIELLRDQFHRTGIRVETRLGQDLPEIFADPNELIQIFTNLLRNAQQAIGRDGRIEIETRTSSSRIEIRITDTGSGIELPANALERIFEGGYTTKRREEGTGLGLAICRRFARRYHGDVLVEWTRLREGTCFLVWLPVRPEAQVLQGENGPRAW